MSKFVCLETDHGETFINLEQVCTAVAEVDSVKLEMRDGKVHTFTNPAAHTLLQSLRHEERVAASR